MRIVDPRFWASLVLSFFLLGTISVGAQEFRAAPMPAPHVAECMETMTALGNFIVMRRAGITKEEAMEMFRVSLKLTKYLLKQQQQPPTPARKIEAQRAVLDQVYDLPDETMSLDNALSTWMRNKMRDCVEANAPSPEPDPNSYRMIPS